MTHGPDVPREGDCSGGAKKSSSLAQLCSLNGKASASEKHTEFQATNTGQFRSSQKFSLHLHRKHWNHHHTAHSWLLPKLPEETPRLSQEVTREPTAYPDLWGLPQPGGRRAPTCPSSCSRPLAPPGIPALPGLGGLLASIFIKQSNSLLMSAGVFVPSSV